MLKTGDRGEDDIGNNDDIITVGISLMIVASILKSKSKVPLTVTWRRDWYSQVLNTFLIKCEYHLLNVLK